MENHWFSMVFGHPTVIERERKASFYLSFCGAGLGMPFGMLFDTFWTTFGAHFGALGVFLGFFLDRFWADKKLVKNGTMVLRKHPRVPAGTRGYPFVPPPPLPLPRQSHPGTLHPLSKAFELESIEYIFVHWLTVNYSRTLFIFF
jgi:hypothetical protein